MKAILITLFLFKLSIGFSQIESRWIGGSPGREQDWFWHKNWSNNRVPDEFTDVRIDDVNQAMNYIPKIKDGHAIVSRLLVKSINGILIDNQASLTVLNYDTERTDALHIDSKGLIVFENYVPR